jgi:hypothetical protein
MAKYQPEGQIDDREVPLLVKSLISMIWTLEKKMRLKTVELAVMEVKPKSSFEPIS